MNAWWENPLDHVRNAEIAAVLLDAGLKSMVVLLSATALCLIWRRASAATKHLIWFLAMTGLLLLPMLSNVRPSWRKPLWSVSTSNVVGNQIALTLEFAPFDGTAVQPTGGRAIGPDAADGVQISSHPSLTARFNKTWLPLGLMVWVCGMMLAVAGLFAGQFQLRKMSRQARRLDEGHWVRLLNDACVTLRLRRHVILLQSAGNVMPLTWGWLRPVVLLPAEAADWTDERKRIVLLHELAHIKRWDCATQFVARLVCALYWFNPLAWVAARRMCIERERACDDLVLGGGCAASDYASHLLEIAQYFRRVPRVGAIAMARASGLERRISAIVDNSRNRRLRWTAAAAMLAAAGGIAVCLGSAGAGSGGDDSATLRQQQIERLKAFSLEKEKQSEKLAAGAGETISEEFRRFFDAATNGDSKTALEMEASFTQRHQQQVMTKGVPINVFLRPSYWSPVLEICLGYDYVTHCDPKYTRISVDEMMNSIPAGCVFFGGTDPGRGLPTAFSKSQRDADPFFTLTQNALADNNYLDYLRAMYGGKIYTPSTNDMQNCFADYQADLVKRMQNNQLKPGETVQNGGNGTLTVSGQGAVVAINGLLTKIIFDKNPDREFFLEQSFPLDWTREYLVPHGLIFKINRQPVAELSEEVVQRDTEYWTKLVTPMVGRWLTPATPVKDVAAFATQAFAKGDLSGLDADPRYIKNEFADKFFSKERESVAELYAWRAQQAESGPEKERMNAAADYAFRQAFALCPYSPEVSHQYIKFLTDQKRRAEALLVAQTVAQMPQMQGPAGNTVRAAVIQLKN